LSDGQKKKKYIEMFGSLTEPFNCSTAWCVPNCGVGLCQ